jgi:hypothetical protein
MASHKLTSQSTYSLPDLCIVLAHNRCFRQGRPSDLVLLVVVLLVDAPVGGGGALLLKLLALGTMDFLLEDWLDLDGLKLGLEVLHVVGRRVTAAAGVRHVWLDVHEFVAGSAPNNR